MEITVLVGSRMKRSALALRLFLSTSGGMDLVRQLF